MTKPHTIMRVTAAINRMMAECRPGSDEDA